MDLAAEIHTIALELDDKESLLEVKNMLVHVYLQQDHAKAGQFGFEALDLANEIGKNWLIGYTKFLLGYWSMALAQASNAIAFFKEAHELFADEGAKYFLLNTSNTIANTYIEQGTFEEALRIQKQAIEIATEMDNARQTIMATYAIGNTYLAMKEYTLAEKYFLAAIDLAKQHSNPFEEATASGFLGRTYEAMEQYDKAIEMWDRSALAYGATIRTRDKMALSNNLHKLYKHVGNHEKAYEHLLNYLDIKVKLQDEARIKETTKLQQLYEKEKRETELKELTIKQQQTELQQAESELKAIKAQMNPHFIFNALNTIQSYIYLNDKQNASNYLGKFSRLTRMILDMSNHEVVSLTDELEALTLYLQLECMRFEEVLTFHIKVADGLDTEAIKLPAMLIQPYIENAIKHGLLHKKDNRTLYCTFTLSGQNLVVSIDDNGVGRQRSGELNATKMDNHKSFATQANAKRFSLLGKDGSEALGAAYTDKLDAQGQPAGTLVVLTIPVQFDGVMA
jgi:tetratricopeptide (TPR) repeat protein